MTAVDRKTKKDRPKFLILPIAEPPLTTVQNLRSEPGKGLQGVFLPEDHQQVMENLLATVAATVVGSLVSARSLWIMRRETPSLIVQPVRQLHRPQERSGFMGFNPDGALFDRITDISLNPRTHARLDAAGLITY